MSVKLKIDNRQTVLMEFEDGTSLAAALRRTVPSFSMPCGGKHKCGKCRVKINGNAAPAGEEEKALLGEALAEGFRLACFVDLNEDLVITLPEEQKASVEAAYFIPDFYADGTGFGLACDIGTTTVAMQLVELRTGRVLAQQTAENAQRAYGADVISRIEACKNGGLAVLSELIFSQIQAMAEACIAEAGVSGINRAVITGNSTMLHIFEGLDPSSLAVYPFNTVSDFGCISSKKLCGAEVYLPRCISAYIGADILCAILASDMMRGGVQLLADIGTNGEMALYADGRLVCCSAAAGPAFEGAGLSCGMRAEPGAIDHVLCGYGKASFSTIGHRPPKGICGSGVLDTAAAMLRLGVTDESGYMEQAWDVAGSGVRFSPQDMRQLQLAKAAVCAGIITLLESEGISASDVDRFVLAGGFGKAMHMDSAVEIGLFPAELMPAAEYIGNGALGGAVMLLCDTGIRDSSETLADSASEITLSGSGLFADNFVDCMELRRF